MLLINFSLNVFLQLVEGSDFRKSEKSILELVDFLDSISGAIISIPRDDYSENIAFQFLSEIHRYVSASTLDQVVTSLKSSF